MTKQLGLWVCPLHSILNGIVGVRGREREEVGPIKRREGRMEGQVGRVWGVGWDLRGRWGTNSRGRRECTTAACTCLPRHKTRALGSPSTPDLYSTWRPTPMCKWPFLDLPRGMYGSPGPLIGVGSVKSLASVRRLIPTRRSRSRSRTGGDSSQE